MEVAAEDSVEEDSAEVASAEDSAPEEEPDPDSDQGSNGDKILSLSRC